MEGLRSSTTNWSDWVVLAHEVGHHVAQHMDPSFPNHEAEQQADYFAGFILQKLGASRSDVQLAMAMVSNDTPTLTHPGKAKVRKGWEVAAGGAGANVIPAVLPVGERPAVVVTPAQPEQRVALLIGNTKYRTWGSPLKNPRNDVVAVGQQLRALGFATTIVYAGSLVRGLDLPTVHWPMSLQVLPRHLRLDPPANDNRRLRAAAPLTLLTLVADIASRYWLAMLTW